MTVIERPDGKAGLERLWLLIVLAIAYTAVSYTHLTLPTICSV